MERMIALLASIDSLIGHEDLDLGAVTQADCAKKRDAAQKAAKELRALLVGVERDFRAIGEGAIDAFNKDSGDAESSELKAALDTARTYVPNLPPDSENWAI